MTREQFREAILPLSKKEIFYREHPSHISSQYKNSNFTLMNGEKVYHFPDFYNIATPDEALKLCSHIIGTDPERFKVKPLSYLALNKQTRYSVVPLHNHAYIEMNYVYSGSCTAIIDSRTIKLEKGDVCILDKDVVHTIKPLGEKDIVLNLMISQEYFTPSFIGRISNGEGIARFVADSLNDSVNHNRFIHLNLNDSPLSDETIENIFCEYLEPGICYSDVILNYMNLLFTYIARSFHNTTYLSSSRGYIVKIINYIEENCTTCTLEDTARHFSLHPNYLSRAIKNATGSTFKSMVTKNRLKLAEFMLKNTDKNISDIARETGFSNQNQFYKKFTEQYNCTPKEYRNK